jgi:hypothetical protein
MITGRTGWSTNTHAPRARQNADGMANHSQDGKQSNSTRTAQRRLDRTAIHKKNSYSHAHPVLQAGPVSPANSNQSDKMHPPANPATCQYLMRSLTSRPERAQSSPQIIDSLRQNPRRPPDTGALTSANPGSDRASWAGSTVQYRCSRVAASGGAGQGCVCAPTLSARARSPVLSGCKRSARHCRWDMTVWLPGPSLLLTSRMRPPSPPGLRVTGSRQKPQGHLNSSRSPGRMLSRTQAGGYHLRTCSTTASITVPTGGYIASNSVQSPAELLD